MKTYFARGVLAVLVCTALAIAGPLWREDDDGGEDAGNTPDSAQETTGEGGIAALSGRLDGLAGPMFGPGGPAVDFDDVYIICIDDPDAFRASTADGGGFSEFDSRLYLFSLDGFGIVGNNTPTSMLSLDAGGPQFDGAILVNAATDATGSEVITTGLYLLAITVAPRTPLGPNGEPIFFFEAPDEVSGPDGPDGDEPLVEWNTAFGACCVSGMCLLQTEAGCDEAGGDYQGDGSICAGVECPLPSNDLCENAFSITTGDTPFDTTNATTDGPNPTCDGGVALVDDVWYDFVPSADGLLSVSTCNQADFDTVLAIYGNCDCPADNVDLLACNDDAFNCDGNTSIVSAIVEAGSCVKIRVGGFGGSIGFGEVPTSGTGILTLTLEPVGACCFYKYDCQILTQSQCNSMEGGYQGDGTTCIACTGLADMSAGPSAAEPPSESPTAQQPGGPGGIPVGLHPSEVVLEASVGGDTPEADGEYTIVVEGVCFATSVPIGGCDFADGSCAETTEFECVADGGVWQGDGTLCPPDLRSMYFKKDECPAPVNPSSNGVLKAMLIGEDDFDVHDVDQSTIVLSRVDGVGGAASPNPPPPGLHIKVKDLSGPQAFDGTCSCEGVTEADGRDDLEIPFRASDLAGVLELDGLEPGAELTLALTGLLVDGTPFEARDCIMIAGVESVLEAYASPPGTAVETTPSVPTSIGRTKR